MQVAPALLEEWLREHYFNAEIDIGSSCVQNFSLAELRRIVPIPDQELNEVVFDDSPTCGNPRLRRAIAEQWGNGDTRHVMATHGSSEVIFLAVNALLRPEDEVIALDPCYFSYRNLAESKGCRLKSWRLRFENKFEPDFDELKRLITPRTRMVMVNFPHNPTGALVNIEQQKELIGAAAEVGAYLIWDTALAALTYDEAPLPDAHLLYERAISIGTLSKAYGLAGLRVGWCQAAPEVIEQFVHLRDYTTLYLSPLVELIAARAIERADDILRVRLPTARANLEILTRWVEAHGELIEWVRPRGGVTAFPRFRYISNIPAFCRRLTEERGVMLVPGQCFSSENHVRLGFGGPTTAFQEGLNRLSHLLRLESDAEPHDQPSQLQAGNSAICLKGKTMSKLSLTNEENASIRSLLDVLMSKHSSAEDPQFLSEAWVFAHELPRRIRSFLNDFKQSEQAPGICLISGFPVDDKSLGNTPPHWKDRPAFSLALAEEMLLVLYGSLLGDIFGWATEQDGHIVHDVFPIKENEDKQISTSSAQTIWWHTEDAFHAFSGDYVGMFCLRNREQVPTTHASLDLVQLKPEHVKVLFEPRYLIHPDTSHLESNGFHPPQKTHETKVDPNKIAVFFGHPQSPYMRIDPYFMECRADDKEAQEALDALVKSIDGALASSVLQAGDCCFIDNCRTVHGRKAFKARYDGTDRWLKRICVTRDLRKSRSARDSNKSRLIL